MKKGEGHNHILVSFQWRKGRRKKHIVPYKKGIVKGKERGERERERERVGTGEKRGRGYQKGEEHWI